MTEDVMTKVRFYRDGLKWGCLRRDITTEDQAVAWAREVANEQGLLVEVQHINQALGFEDWKTIRPSARSVGLSTPLSPGFGYIPEAHAYPEPPAKDIA
jgi:hypothetical protein